VQGQSGVERGVEEPANPRRDDRADHPHKVLLAGAVHRGERGERTGQALRGAGIGLIVIDEVHCVSMWGQDFRPDYLFIGSALETLDNPPVLGLTATATPTTAEDIAASLGRDMDVVRTSVVRDNLRYEVRHVDNEDDRRRELVALAGSIEGPGIVYARSREKCEGLAQLLRKHGVHAQHYHAGLPPDERSDVQEQFLVGTARVIVATTAFGMGIDKPDVRTVIHTGLPGSLEGYYQEIGRAGRDGRRRTRSAKRGCKRRCAGPR